MFPDNFILERYVAEDVILAIPGVRLGVFGQLYFGPSALLTENLFMFGEKTTQFCFYSKS